MRDLTKKSQDVIDRWKSNPYTLKEEIESALFAVQRDTATRCAEIVDSANLVWRDGRQNEVMQEVSRVGKEKIRRAIEKEFSLPPPGKI